MASIRKEFEIDASPEHVWDAVRDFGAVHTRLAPGFVVDTRLEGGTRVITFGNGLVAREHLVDCDDARRRLAYAITEGRTTHYNASMQILAAEAGRSRAVWIIDVLPDAMADAIGSMADAGVRAMRATLEARAAQAGTA